jgi:hypothetical protein
VIREMAADLVNLDVAQSAAVQNFTRRFRP